MGMESKEFKALISLLDDDDEKTPEQRELEARDRDRDSSSEHRSEHRSDLDDRQPPGGSGTS